MTKQAAQTPQNPEPENKRKKRFKNAGYIVLVILLLALAAGGVYARYVYKNVNSGTVLAREFYFTSDQLSASGATYTLNPGTTSVTLNLKNHADSLRFSTDTICYTVAVDNEATILDENDNPVTNGTIVGGVVDAVTLKLSGLKDGKTYIVTAVGEAGYKETLTATFTVLSAGTKVYKHLDTADPAYVLLTVWTENVTGDATIVFPDRLIPDATDPVLDDITNYSNGTYASGSFDDEIKKDDEGSFNSPYSSRTYRFFKVDTAADYEVEQFAVSVGTTTAAPSTPQ